MGNALTGGWVTAYGPGMLKRLAAALAVLFVLGAVAATFLPTAPGGASCGTWVSPEWNDDDVDALLEDFEGLYDRAIESELYDFAGEAEGSVRGVMFASIACESALSTRRAVALSLLGAAAVVPLAVLFVAGRREQEPGPESQASRP